ncbi:hypothetical protein F2Q69_00039752 [Brassica cretica]|uniref:SMP domain-containing protein n=4 Tax=Brassica TaxID=3705 RepID=A0A8S9N6E2_BRACR|nr:hypothetical protein F2Q69_00039752 [Brassica cretica]
MCVEQLEKPITYDVKQEAEKIPATEKSSEAAEGEVRKEKVVANPPASEVTITIGEALDAKVLTAGNKPVEWSDAAAIQAAEVRATGRTNIMPGGVAASAQSAATLNARANSEDDKTTLAVVLTVSIMLESNVHDPLWVQPDETFILATNVKKSKLLSDKPATRKDTEGVTGAEMRNDPHLTIYPVGSLLDGENQKERQKRERREKEEKTRQAISRLVLEDQTEFDRADILWEAYSVSGLEIHRRDLDFNGWIFCCRSFSEAGRHSSSTEQSWVFGKSDGEIFSS